MIAKMKNILVGINSRTDDLEEQISNPGRQDNGNHPIRIEKKKEVRKC